MPEILALPGSAAPDTARPSGLFALLRRWCRNARTRSDLADLPDHILRDIGSDWREARLEARRPFWEA